MLARLDWRIPNRAGLKGLAVLFAATGVAGMVLGGHSTTVAAALTAWSGLAIDEVEITGQSETSEVDVLERLSIGEFRSIVVFDVESAKKRVEDLPWVKEATIRKLYPDTLQVAILEKKPFAIWQHEGRFSLVDQNGKVIADRIGERYATLPVVVGEGAAKRADDFVALIDGFPSLKPMIRAGILVAGRRWNVMLTNGVEILLPELDPGSALTQVVALDDGHHILSRDIAAIDLRLPNRLVVRLTAEGTEARKAMLLDRAKLQRKKGSNA